MAHRQFCEIFTSREHERDFIQWFWEAPQNGNEFLHKLNAFSVNNTKNECIRRERFSPYIYGIVLNLEVNISHKLFRTIKNHDGDIRLMKVGFTRAHTEEGGIRNRTQQIMKEIKENLQDYGIESELIFDLKVNFGDTYKDKTEEKRIRSRLGFHMDPEVARKLELPGHTEWIFTSQRVIEGIKTSMEDWEEKYNSEGKVTRVLTTEVLTSPSFKCKNFDEMLERNALALQDMLTSI